MRDRHTKRDTHMHTVRTQITLKYGRAEPVQPTHTHTIHAHTHKPSERRTPHEHAAILVAGDARHIRATTAVTAGRAKSNNVHARTTHTHRHRDTDTQTNTTAAPRSAGEVNDGAGEGYLDPLVEHARLVALAELPALGVALVKASQRKS